MAAPDNDMSSPEPDNLHPWLLIFGFVNWMILRIVVEYAVKLYKPNLDRELRGHYQAKYMLFIGLLLGLLFKPITLASCGLAVWKTPAEDDIAGIRPPINTYQAHCWKSKIVVYVSELPHYIYLPESLLHRLVILTTMGTVAKWQVPRRGFDTCLAALWAEIPHNLHATLRTTHYLDNYPRLDWHLACWTTIFEFVTRASGIVLSMAMISQSGLQGEPAIMMGSAYMFYLVYVFSLTYRRLKKNGVLQIESSGVFRLRFGGSSNIKSTTLITGFGALVTQASTLAIYTWVKNDASPMQASELADVTWNLVVAVTVAAAGSLLLRRPCSTYWKAEALLTVAVLGSTPALQSSVDRPILIGCVILCSLLGKVASKLASHFASVEQGSDGRMSIISGLLNLAQFVVAVVFVYLGKPVLDVAFQYTVLLQLLIWLAVDFQASESTNSRRKLLKTLAMMATMGALQAMWQASTSSAMGALSGFDTSTTETSGALGRHGWHQIESAGHRVPGAATRTTTEIAAKAFFVFSFIYAVLRMFTGWALCRREAPILSRVRCTPITIVLVCLNLWNCHVAYLAVRGMMPSQHKQHREPQEIIAAAPPFPTLVLSWQFWVAISASVIVSTTAAHIRQPRDPGSAQVR